MPDGTLGLGATIGGVQIGGSYTPTGTARVSDQPTLAAGVAGTLTTRTDANTGIVTVVSHGITTDDSVGLYWSGGSRRGVDVTAITGTTVSIDLGAGTDLPSTSTAVVICKETVLDFDFNGDLALAVAVGATTRAQVEFQQANGTSVLVVELNGSQTSQVSDYWDWHPHAAGGTTNPFAGVVVGKVAVSNGDSAQTCVVSLGVAKSS